MHGVYACMGYMDAWGIWMHGVYACMGYMDAWGERGWVLHTCTCICICMHESVSIL